MPGQPGAGESRRLPTLPGSVPDAACPPPGCRFHPRCPERFEPCAAVQPAETSTGPDRNVACFLFEERYRPGAAGTPE